MYLRRRPVMPVTLHENRSEKISIILSNIPLGVGIMKDKLADSMVVQGVLFEKVAACPHIYQMTRNLLLIYMCQF